MNFIMRSSCILALCFFVQCQAKVIFPDTSYVDEYGNYYDGSAAYYSGSGGYGSGLINIGEEGDDDLEGSSSGHEGSGSITMWDDEEGDDEDDFELSGSGYEGSGSLAIWDEEDNEDDFEGSGSGYEGSGFFTIWENDEGDDEDDLEGSVNGNEGISTIIPVEYEEDLYKNDEDSNVNTGIIFPNEDKYIKSRKDSNVNLRELDHILINNVNKENKNKGSVSGNDEISTFLPKLDEKDLYYNHKYSNRNRSIIFPDEGENLKIHKDSKVNMINPTENKVEVSLEKENMEETLDNFEQILSDIDTTLKGEEFYFNKEVISNSETDEHFANPEAINFIHVDKEHHDSSISTMKIIMFTSAGILIVLVLLLIIILIVYLMCKGKNEKHTTAGEIKRIRLISTNSTMKV